MEERHSRILCQSWNQQETDGMLSWDLWRDILLKGPFLRCGQGESGQRGGWGILSTEESQPHPTWRDKHWTWCSQTWWELDSWQSGHMTPALITEEHRHCQSTAKQARSRGMTLWPPSPSAPWPPAYASAGQILRQGCLGDAIKAVGRGQPPSPQWEARVRE